MNFDRLHAYIDLLKKQKQERKIFLAHGMDAESIDEIFRADYRQLYRDAEFYRHLERYIGTDFDVPADESGSLEPMDEIENPDLFRSLIELKPKERELILLHVVHGLSLKSIASLWNEPYSAVQRRYHRAKEKIKNYL